MASPSAGLKEKVQIWIYCRTPQNGLRVLLFKTLPERGAFWQPVTGSVEPGESLAAGAAREAFEESGLRLQGGVQALDFDFTFQSRGREFHETVFFGEVAAAADRPPEPKLDLREHCESKWVSPEDAISMIHHESNSLALQRLCGKLGFRLLAKK